MILLDTHAWVWWATEPEKLSSRAIREIHGAETIGVAAISVWEVAMLVEKGRLELDRDVLLWARQALALPRVEVLPLLPEIAVASTRLGAGFHGDPADRAIVATAQHHRAGIVTKDARLRAWRAVRTVW